MADDRLPTALWIEGHTRNLTREAIPFYITHTGAQAGGMVLVKLNGLKNGCKVLVQQRDLEGVLKWENATKEEIMDEKKADDYIQRATKRDPDLWVIEIEDPKLNNPFVI